MAIQAIAPALSIYQMSPKPREYILVLDCRLLSEGVPYPNTSVAKAYSIGDKPKGIFSGVGPVPHPYV